jgi:hypothetical protein
MDEKMESKMEAMMERKMKVRYDKKEANWNKMQADWNKTQTTSMERMTQHAKNQIDIVQAIIQDAEVMIIKLNTTLTLVTNRIEEATLSIQEIDKATTVIANYTDAANKSKNEFTTMITAARIETRKDAKAMKLGTKKLEQKLNSTKDKIMTEIQLVSPSTTHVEGLRNAI